jgi:hypothetical protein
MIEVLDTICVVDKKYDFNRATSVLKLNLLAPSLLILPIRGQLEAGIGLWVGFGTKDIA